MKPDKCLLCNAPLIGRSDKKFCSDACRYAYKNKMDKKSNAMLIKVNKVLLINWQDYMKPVDTFEVIDDLLTSKNN